MSKSPCSPAVLLQRAHLSTLIRRATEVSEAARLAHAFNRAHVQAIVILAIKTKAGPIMIPFREGTALWRWMMAHGMMLGGVEASRANGEKRIEWKEMEEGVSGVRRGVEGADNEWWCVWVFWLPNKDKRFPLSETFFPYCRSTKAQIINDNYTLII